MQENDIRELRRKLDEQVEKQLKDSLQNLEHKISSIIDDRINNIVAATLGMNAHWGDWEVDHCNGRKTAIADRIGEMVATKLDAAMDAWVAKVTKEGALPAGWAKGARREFDDQVHRRMREMVGVLAEEFVDQSRDQILARILAEPAKAPKQDDSPKYENP